MIWFTCVLVCEEDVGRDNDIGDAHAQCGDAAAVCVCARERAADYLSAERRERGREGFSGLYERIAGRTAGKSRGEKNGDPRNPVSGGKEFRLSVIRADRELLLFLSEPADTHTHTHTHSLSLSLSLSHKHTHTRFITH